MPVGTGLVALLLAVSPLPRRSPLRKPLRPVARSAYGAGMAHDPDAPPAPPSEPAATAQPGPEVVSSPSSFPVAPHVTLPKYEKMQGRRVRAVVASTQGFNNLMNEVVRSLQTRFPELRVQLLVEESEAAVPSFSIRIDGVLCASSSTPGRLYLPYSRIAQVIERARRRRRPNGDMYDGAPATSTDAEMSWNRELEDRWHPAVRDEEEPEAEQGGDDMD